MDEKRAEYVEQAKIRLKEMKLTGSWSEKMDFGKINETATLNMLADDTGKPVWWVIDGDMYSFLYETPEEALADWLEAMDG